MKCRYLRLNPNLSAPASKFIPIGTVIEISPVLLFTKEEYEEHGRHTILDQYTFKWRDGRMALALGLGSLFNHSETPNVSFILDTSTNSIRFTTARDINPDEEMCIFYGFNLWFQPAHSSRQTCIVTPEPTDDWGGLAPLVHGFDNVLTLYPDFLDGNADDIIPPEELPFTRLKVGRDEEEEHLDEICTGALFSLQDIYLNLIHNTLPSTSLGCRHTRFAAYYNHAEVCTLIN